MRLAQFTIRRFKGIDELTLTLPKTEPSRPGSADFLTLLGQNNSCKSSVLEALRLALPSAGLKQPTIEHFPHHNRERGPIEVELVFDELTDADCRRRGIRGHVYRGRYHIRKLWTKPGRPHIEVFIPGFQIPGFPDAASEGRAGFVAKGPRWQTLIDQFEAEHGPLPLRRLPERTADTLRRFVYDHAPDLIKEGKGRWHANPGGIQANPDSAMPVAIYVAAVQEVKSAADPATAHSAAQALVKFLFERSLAEHTVITAFREAAQAVQLLFDNGSGDSTVLNIQSTLTTRLQRLIDVEVDITFSSTDFATDFTRATMLHIVDSGVRTYPEHQGHGAQRALILTLLEMYAEQLRHEQGAGPNEGFDRGVILLMEEPEIYLHPQMCRKMRDVLMQIARSGTGQVICTSHSPVFIDLADRHDGIAILRRVAGHVHGFQRLDDLFAGDLALDARRRLRMLLDFDPSVNEVFFASQVCLVEGDCEVSALTALTRRLLDEQRVDAEHLARVQRRTTIVNCRGKWTILAFQRVLNGFQIPYCVVHDADTEGEAGANAQILTLLGGQRERRLLHAPNFEGQIWGETWVDDKPWRATRKILDAPLPEALLTFFQFVLQTPLAQLAPDEAALSAPPPF